MNFRYLVNMGVWGNPKNNTLYDRFSIISLLMYLSWDLNLDLSSNYFTY